MVVVTEYPAENQIARDVLSYRGSSDNYPMFVIEVRQFPECLFHARKRVVANRKRDGLFRVEIRRL